MRTSASHRCEHRSTVDDPHLTADVLCALVAQRRRNGRQTAMSSDVLWNANGHEPSRRGTASHWSGRAGITRSIGSDD